LIALFLTALPSFGSHGQPSRSSQFHVNQSHLSHKKGGKAAAHRPGGDKAPSALVKAAANTAHKGRFKNSVRGLSSVSSVSFVAGTRTAWGGTDDQESESVLGDFNGDGKMDVARVVTDTKGNPEISVLLSNGDGTFKTAVITALPADTDAPFLVGDLNGDGKADLVLVQPFGNNCTRSHGTVAPQTIIPCGSSVFVFISNGDGTFATPVIYPVTAASLQGGLLTDVNGDGKLDILAFDDSFPANVIELLGDGTGVLGSGTVLGQLTTNAPNNMIFADFNGDGKIDFAGQGKGGQLEVTLATGAGLYANAPVSLTTRDGNYGACNSTAGDLSGDSKPEIVSFNCNDNTVTVYVNQGDGTFAPGVYYNNNADQNQGIFDGAIADLNGDGKNDIVVINEFAADVSVFLGHGDGTVSVKPSSYAVGGYAWNTPLIADLNGDGLMDVVESDDLYSLVYLQGYGDGTFRASPTYPLPNSFDQGAYTYSVASGDFNGDGIADVVVGEVRNNGSTGVVVYLGKGDGTFSTGVSYGDQPNMSYVAVADFNGDGKLDIAAIDRGNSLVQIFLGNGDGTFNIGASYPTSPAGNASSQNLVVGDFNKDGKMDIAVANSNTQDVGVLLGHGDGTFADAVSYPTTGYSAYDIKAADLNGDGDLDLAVVAYTTGGVPAIGIVLADSNAPGTFGTANFVAVNGRPNNIALGDLNKDGKIDMAVTEHAGTVFNGQIEIFLNDGTGTFAAAPTAYPASAIGGAGGDSWPLDIQMFDMNGDGNLDLVYLNDDYGTLAVALGNGDGTIAAPTEFPSTEYVAGLALADVNGDGAMDVLTGEDEAGGFSVFLNANGTGAVGNYTMGTTTPSSTVAAGASATYTLDLAGSNGYTGTITFACTNLPKAAACTFSPSSVVSNGDTPLTTVMSISTMARSSAAASLRRGPTPGPTTLLASLGGIGLLGLLLAGRGQKARRRRAGIVFGVLLLMTLGTVVACDNENSTVKTGTGTPAGAYAVTVTSTGTGTNAPTHSLNVTLVVQ
jgi:FG-GAP-like repeat/FG-GAP repeat